MSLTKHRKLQAYAQMVATLNTNTIKEQNKS
jgi:hypothetical protein